MNDRLHLSGRRVLVVGIDQFVSRYVEIALISAGANVHHAKRREEALAALASEGHSFVAGIVDACDEIGSLLLIAAALAERRVPLVLHGNAQAPVPALLRNNPFMRQPFAGYQMVEAVSALCGRSHAR